MKKNIYLTFVILISFSIKTFSQSESWIENVTKDVGLDSARASYVYVVDINNDHYPDIAIIEANLNKGHIKLYRNIQKPGSSNPKDRFFEDITKGSHIDIRRNGEKGRVIDNVIFGDIDNDGDNDCITGIYYHRWEYYHPDSNDPGDRCEVLLNKGWGEFELVENSGLNKIGPHSGNDEGLVNTTGMSFLDYNLDGNLDVFVASWFDDYKNNKITSSYMLKGNGDGTFTDVSFETWIEQNDYPLYGVNATDWNNDGWMDIATSPYCRSGGSLWKNMKNGRFRDVAKTVGYNTQFLNGDGWADMQMTKAKALCTWASQPADFDNDGDMDFFYVLVHGGFGNDVFGKLAGRSTIVVNKGESGNYELEWALDRVERKPPRASHIGDYDACWFDLDNDMLLDLAVGNGGYSNNTRLFISQQQSDNYFDDISSDIGIAGVSTMIRELYSIQPIDFDLDGDDDILLCHGNGEHEAKHEVLLIENKVGEFNNWVGIKLDPPQASNKSGIGSRITVYSGGVAQTREVSAGFGHFSGQQPFIRNFGLDNNSTVDSIVIRWQTNPITYTRVSNPPINDIIVINKNGYWGTLGTKEKMVKNESIQLFPNPVSDILNVKINAEFTKEGVYKIFTMDGKVVKNAKFISYNNSIISISTAELSSGYYLIRFFSDKDISKVLPFVKK
ncbi:MAG: FG-GAP-like repeat-containing protein [Bacteroidota bacterium]|nr:FG-GAP-like repeat-containing protein [Bacteroidota bacterium]